MIKVITDSVVLDKASVRAQGMKGISATLDLGSGLSVVAIEAAINDARAKQEAYNQLATILEEKLAAFEDAEKMVNHLATRVLASVAGKYGKDSIEYAQVGGTRSRDRKRVVRKPKSATKSVT